MHSQKEGHTILLIYFRTLYKSFFVKLYKITTHLLFFVVRIESELGPMSFSTVRQLVKILMNRNSIELKL